MENISDDDSSSIDGEVESLKRQKVNDDSIEFKNKMSLPPLNLKGMSDSNIDSFKQPVEERKFVAKQDEQMFGNSSALV